MSNHIPAHQPNNESKIECEITFGIRQPHPSNGRPSLPSGQGASSPGTPCSPLSPLSPFRPRLPARSLNEQKIFHEFIIAEFLIGSHFYLFPNEITYWAKISYFRQ